MSKQHPPRVPDGDTDPKGDEHVPGEIALSPSDASASDKLAASPPDDRSPPQSRLPTDGVSEVETSGQRQPVSDWLATDAPISFVAPMDPDRWQRAWPMPSRFGDYELLGEIGRGGMGITYRARQISLNRFVAIKMIKSGQLASREEVLRFHAEAEAAAALDHAHIVPVFEVGQENGQHYFSMGYVEGCSLEQKLRDGPLPPRDAARLMVDVAEAVHCAHDHGIIHRDLKPGNILLARKDRSRAAGTADLPSSQESSRVGKHSLGSGTLVPKITDFGLAKRLQADADLTVTGQVLGTPGFMPPEQAEARGCKVGPAADIYALGAILYNSITGRPPFQAAGILETLAQVLEREPVSPRLLNSMVDRDLETICLKCLEKDPTHRYATAQQLADELRRFLEHRPIAARPISRLARLGRWCKRRPALAASIAALVTALVGGTLVSSYYAVQSQKSAEFYRQEKVRADQETTRAQAALASEHEALGKLTQSLEETERTIYTWVETTRNTALLHEPRFKPVLRDLLEQALTHYERFVEQHAGDQTIAMRRQLANAFFQIGEIHSESGSADQAISAYRRATAMNERLARDNPQDLIHLWGLGTSQTNLGMLLGETGQVDEAISTLEQALATLEQLVDIHEQDNNFAFDLAKCCDSLGLLYTDNGRAAAGLAVAQRARDIRSRLAAQHPDDPDAAWALAISIHNLGRSCSETANMDDAAKHFDDAKAMLTRLADEHPNRADYRRGLARVHHSLGALYWQIGDLDKAVSSVQDQQVILSRLTAENPTVSQFQHDMAMSHDTMGALLAARGEFPEAIAESQEACRLLEVLVGENASVTRFAFDLAGVRFNMGNFHADSGSPDPAVEEFQRALAIQQQLVKDNPTVMQYRCELANTLNSLGIVYSEMDRASEAIDAYRQALSFEEKLVQDNPHIIAFAVHLGGTYVNLASLQQDGPEAAVLEAGKAVDILEEVWRHEPGLMTCQLYLRNAHWTRAEALEELRRYRQAADDWRRVVQLDLGPDRWKFAAHHSLSLVLSGQFRQAVAAAWQSLRYLLDVDESTDRGKEVGPSVCHPHTRRQLAKHDARAGRRGRHAVSCLYRQSAVARRDVVPLPYVGQGRSLRGQYPGHYA